MPEVNARTVVTGLLVTADRIAVYWHARKQWFGSESASWEEALRINHTDVSGMAGGKVMLRSTTDSESVLAYHAYLSPA